MDKVELTWFISLLLRIMTAAVTTTVLIFAGLFTIPRLFGIEPYIVRSSSMEPTIAAGAVAMIDTRMEPETAGQIIAFQVAADDGDEPVTVLHRIKAAEGDGWITKGDANDEADGRIVYPEAVVGTYLFSVPRAGFILAGAQGGKILTAAGIVVLLNVLSILADEILGNSRKKEPAG